MFPTFLDWSGLSKALLALTLVWSRSELFVCSATGLRKKQSERTRTDGKMPSMGGIMKKISSGKLSKSSAVRKVIGNEKDRAKNR
jgi:hypothetical protein